MKEITLREALIQATETEAVDLFKETLRGCVRAAFFDAIEEEVQVLCGGKYKPNESDYRRAGSEHGSVYLNGEKEAVVRPRVRHNQEGEVQLEVYNTASSQRNLFDEVVAHVEQGLSHRGVARAKGKGLSKSAASRMWAEKSREQLEKLRSRNMDGHEWVGIMIDGIRLAQGVWIVIALGIDLEGEKVMLDFEEGSSENATCVGGLIERLKKRGIGQNPTRKLLVVRDGSTAIASAVSKYWPDAVQQECQIHMQRRVRDQLRKRDKAEFDGYCKKLRQAQGKDAGEEAFDELLDFVSERNGAAALALKERRDGLLAFQRLDVSSTLNTTFLNTNCIENSIRNWREATGNVKRWSEKKDMVSRWSASGMLWAESGFRKIRNAKDLGELATTLSVCTPGASLRSEPSVPTDKVGKKRVAPKQ